MLVGVKFVEVETILFACGNLIIPIDERDAERCGGCRGHGVEVTFLLVHFDVLRRMYHLHKIDFRRAEVLAQFIHHFDVTFVHRCKLHAAVNIVESEIQHHFFRSKHIRSAVNPVKLLAKLAAADTYVDIPLRKHFAEHIYAGIIGIVAEFKVTVADQ